ncbi:CHAT domain-containing protein [Hymenobacter sp. BT635]|uniref:CHAT domain-containing protein n=1 Tax=Hymenobacter nitidus TaxID=2880929 RepID=A0ABS8AJ24_9BACT|nr:CHAT domain-containing protein [Hymenobacter nitidus]MCB2380433.1 CHAT domain-containing protein [Hymenobacter nitidus]
MKKPLELLILDTGQDVQAVAYARYNNNSAVEIIQCNAIPALNEFRIRLNQVATGEAASPPTKEELSIFGKNLFNFAFNKKVLDVYRRLPNETIKIQVISNRPDFQSLPWEYLQDPMANIGPNRSRGIVRIVPTIGNEIPEIRKLKNKLRLLFVYADPTDQAYVAWEDIQNTIEREFLGRLEQGTFEMKVIEGSSIEQLNEALISNSYDILHFNGHGSIIMQGVDKGTGILVFRDRVTGESQEVPASKLAMILSGRNLQLVVLSACNSSAGDFSKSYAVVAQALVESGIPAVVANQFAVTNSIAATFSSGLYRGLLATGDIDEAVAEGRQVLALADHTTLEWGIPTLYRHVDASKLFEV